MAAPSRNFGRSRRLLQAFRTEATDPDGFYDLLAEDALANLRPFVRLAGATVLDVGGGAGYLTRAARRAGAHCHLLDPDLAELSWRGEVLPGAVLADGCRLPLRPGGADLALCSNVLEHSSDPVALCDELVRAVHPGGGLVWVSFTNWFSPWGGHETSPWHLLGGDYALARYERRHGEPPKNRYRSNLFPLSVAAMLRWARQHRQVEVLDAGARYHPWWARQVVLVPGLREVATWNLELLLRRTR